MYLATFDSQGRRITSYVVGMHKDIPSDAVQISDEDQSLYVTGNYYRTTEGTPALIPEYVPTVAENKTAEINVIDAKYALIYADYLSKGQSAAYLGKTTAATVFKTKYNTAMATHVAEIQEVNVRYEQ